jgi:hypothetical protein
MCDGIEHINNWVAKVRFSDPSPSISKHATDALMYKGFQHILDAFKDTIECCGSLEPILSQKAMKIKVSTTFNPLCTSYKLTFYLISFFNML